MIEKAFRKRRRYKKTAQAGILKTSAEVLEFEALRQLVGRYIASPLGKRELEKVSPLADRAQLDTALAEAGEAIQYLHAALHPQSGGARRRAAHRVRRHPRRGARGTQTAHRRRRTRAQGNLRAVHPARRRRRRQVAPDRGRRALPAPGPPRRRPSANSAPCCANWTARSSPTAAWPITPASRWRACAAISSGRRSPSTNRSSASCAPTARKACCRRSSSPSATSASWSR